MAPKKDKKKEDEKQKVGQFTEVEKTFLELQLAECNRKIARLQAAVSEYEQKNDKLQKAYDTLDEDRADIIAYLKKTLNTKSEENNELKEKVKGLEETREIELAEFMEKGAELENNFDVMKEQLTSENKLLASKLNTLEEFRGMRDDLMKKFESQEQAYQDQELKYKRIIYDTEKKFVIGKDKLKKEMEARLLQLAQDFQDATELRIAASTHRVIRENIAINNELDRILISQTKLAELNDKYKKVQETCRVAQKIAEEEKNETIKKNMIQMKVIDRLTNRVKELETEKKLNEKQSSTFITNQAKIDKLTEENENLSQQIRILEQNLISKMTDQNKSYVECSKIYNQNTKLKEILQEAAIAVQSLLKLTKYSSTDPACNSINRDMLLSGLLEIVTQYREIQLTQSNDTLESVGIYEEGDLGFVPRPCDRRNPRSAPRSATTLISGRETINGKEICSTTALNSSKSLESLKTIPSLQVLIEKTEQQSLKESDPSFITSITDTLNAEKDNEVTEKYTSQTSMEKELARSVLKMQKSLMSDVTGIRQPMLISNQDLSKTKSVIISKKPYEVPVGEEKEKLNIFEPVVEQKIKDNLSEERDLSIDATEQKDGRTEEKRTYSEQKTNEDEQQEN